MKRAKVREMSMSERKPVQTLCMCINAILFVSMPCSISASLSTSALIPKYLELTFHIAFLFQSPIALPTMVNTVRQSLNRRWSHVKNKLSIEAPTTVPTTTPPNPSPAHSTATGGQSDSSNATWPTAEYKLANPLLDFGLLKIPADDYTWFNNVNLAIRDLMNGPNYDASHNYQHARRVVANGKNILEHEVKHHEWARKLDPMVIYLGCLVYSVGSTKFRTIGED